MGVKASGQCTLSSTVDISAATCYYLLQASTATKPAKPTVKTPSNWTTTEPTYTTGSTNSLYTCYRTDLSDGTFAWSDVSLSTSYEAAKAAYNLANTAKTTADATANYFSHDAAGAHVGSVSGNLDSGKNLLMATGKIAFRDGAAEMGTIGVSTESGRTLMDITCGDSYDGIMLDGGAYVMNKQHVSDTTYGAYGSYITCSMHETAAPRASLVAHRGDGTTSHPIDVEAELDVGVVGGKSYINLSADKISVLDWKLVGTQVGTTHVSIPTTAREIFVDARAAFNSAANWSFLFVAPMLTTTPVLQIQGWYTDPYDCGNVSVFATNTEVWLFSLQLASTHYESSSTIHVYYR